MIWESCWMACLGYYHLPCLPTNSCAVAPLAAGRRGDNWLLMCYKYWRLKPLSVKSAYTLQCRTDFKPQRTTTTIVSTDNQNGKKNPTLSGVTGLKSSRISQKWCEVCRYPCTFVLFCFHAWWLFEALSLAMKTKWSDHVSVNSTLVFCFFFFNVSIFISIPVCGQLIILLPYMYGWSSSQWIVRDKNIFLMMEAGTAFLYRFSMVRKLLSSEFWGLCHDTKVWGCWHFERSRFED